MESLWDIFKKGDEDLLSTVIIIEYKKEADTFFKQNVPKTRPRYLVNFDRSLTKIR